MAARKAAASNGHRLVSLDELLKMPLPTEEVVIPNTDVKIELHALNGLERAKLADQLPKGEMDAPDGLRFVHKLIAASLPGATEETVAQLPAPVIDRLRDAAMRLAGLGEQAVAAAEVAVKATPSGDSG